MKKLIIQISLALLLTYSGNTYASDSTMDDMSNHLRANGITKKEIIRIKTMPVWPTYNLVTGKLVSGDQRFFSPDFRSVYIYTVTNVDDSQIITIKKLFDYNRSGGSK